MVPSLPNKPRVVAVVAVVLVTLVAVVARGVVVRTGIVGAYVVSVLAVEIMRLFE